MPESMREQLEEAFDDDAKEQEETGGSAEDAPEPLGVAAETTGDGSTGEKGGDEQHKDDDASAGVPDKRGKILSDDPGHLPEGKSPVPLGMA